MRSLLRFLRQDAGTTTIEYAIGCIVGASFGLVLLKIVQSGPVGAALSRVVQSALAVGM